IRPKPLIPTRIVTVLNLLVDPLIASGSETIGRRPADGASLLWSRPYQKPQSRHRTGSVPAAASPAGLAGGAGPWWRQPSRELFADLSIRARRTRLGHEGPKGRRQRSVGRRPKGMTVMKQYLLSIYQP